MSSACAVPTVVKFYILGNRSKHLKHSYMCKGDSGVVNRD